MKRLHIHVAVDDLAKSINFYSAMFGVSPTKQKDDYAKWMLDDPRINFAISSRGAKIGLDHLGLQVDSTEELEALRKQMKAADLSLFDEGETTCCYAASEKSWVKDPSGIPWEAYHTMADVALFSVQKAGEKSACCTPKLTPVEESSNCSSPKGGCC
jgi:catechol 2,3-dioxygenase-like lactoylglutathione lyase family enzyme